MWSDRPCGVIALFDLRHHILSQRNMWSDRPCGVIALFDLRYHIVSHGQTIGVIVYMRSVRRGSVRSITHFLEQPHGMSRVHCPSDHITGMITPVGWTTDDRITGIITVNANSPRSCRRSRQPPGLLGDTAAAATDPAAGPSDHITGMITSLRCRTTGGRNPCPGQRHVQGTHPCAGSPEVGRTRAPPSEMTA